MRKKFSIIELNSDEGNLRFFFKDHVWHNNKCIYCGCNKNIYNREEDLENYAYSFIHTKNPEEFFNMRFDVIIGNPPYHMKMDDRKGGIMKPIYHKFIEQAVKLNPRYLSMIIPSRWFAGGVGLDDFRKDFYQINV